MSSASRPDRDLSKLHPELRSAWYQLVHLMRLAGHPVFMTEGYRTPERQSMLYAKGRTAPGPKVTNAKAGKSLHNATDGPRPASRALDFAFKAKEPYAESHPWDLVAALAPLLGLKSGASFGDRPHLELDSA